MEHFLVVTSSMEQHTRITMILKNTYPSCMVHAVTSKEFTDQINIQNFLLVIVFSNHVQQSISLSITTGHSVLFVAHNDEQGMHAIQAGADDYVLLSQVDNDFAIAIQKIITRRKIAPPQKLADYSKGETYELMLTALNEVIWCKNTEDFTLEYVNDACETVFGYPPFSRLIKITFKHADEQKATIGAELMAKALTTLDGLTVQGPGPAIVPRVRNMYIMEIWIKCPRDGKLLDNVKTFLKEQKQIITGTRGLNSIQVLFDVDPV